MKNLILKHSSHRIIAENIRFLFCLAFRQNKITANNNNRLKASYYKLSTTIPQKLWKTFKNPVCLKTCVILLSMLILVSCNPFKSTKPTAQKGHPAMENAIISMSEEEVKKKLGDPDVVSKTPENNIIWTYKEPWKIMPDNKNTIYIEFENGKVIKIIKAR